MNETYLKPTKRVSRFFTPIKFTTVNDIMVKGRTENRYEMLSIQTTPKEKEKNCRKLSGPIVRKY